MSTEEIKETAGVGVAAPKKRRGRGISNETRSVARKKFDEMRDANKSNALFIGHLDNVEVNWATLKEDANIPQFAGLAVPYLTFTFASNEENANDRKYATVRFGAVESNTETIPGGKAEWKVNVVFQFMKHVYEVFVLKGRAMTEAEEDALTLPFEDFQDNGEGGYEYVPLESDVIVNGYKTLFENFVKLMNNDGKPHYKTATGGILPIWMKLLRFIRQKNEWKPVLSGNQAGELAFPTFIGEGVIELFKQGVAPSLKVDAHKESITFKEEAMKAKTPNVGAPGAGIAGGVAPVPNAAFGGSVNPAFGGSAFPSAPTMDAGAEELPF